MNDQLCQQYRQALRLGRCTNRASFRYTWPGRTESTVCQTCSHKLRNVAAAMGFALELMPVDAPRDTLPAPPLNSALEAEDDPPWMRDTQPGKGGMPALADALAQGAEVPRCPVHHGAAKIWDTRDGWVCLSCELAEKGAPA